MEALGFIVFCVVVWLACGGWESLSAHDKSQLSHGCGFVVLGYVSLVVVYFVVIQVQWGFQHTAEAYSRNAAQVNFVLLTVMILAGLISTLKRANAGKKAQQLQYAQQQELLRLEDAQQQERASWQAVQQQLLAQAESEKAARIVAAKGSLRQINDAVFRADCIVIDSNIWMNEQFDDLFACLHRIAEEMKRELVLSAPQFDEICNLKRKTPFGDNTNMRARCAIHRIEEFQTAGLLRIESVTINAHKDAYADPAIVKLLVAAAQQKERICFISDDKELRVRVREHLRPFPADQWRMPDGDDLLNMSHEVAKAMSDKILTWEACWQAVCDGDGMGLLQ